MSKAKIYFYSIGFAALMIYTSLFLAMSKKAEAEAAMIRIPFAGQIATMLLCCNGLEFVTTGQYQSVAYGTFILPWTNMIPIPQAGIGLYSYWSVLPSEKVLGDSIAGGTCELITTYGCTSSAVLYTVLQMGTTAIPS